MFDIKATFRYDTFAPVLTLRFWTFAKTMFADCTFVVSTFAMLTLAIYMTFKYVTFAPVKTLSWEMFAYVRTFR